MTGTNMTISKAVKRMLLVIPAAMLLSSVSWGQTWVGVNVGVAPAGLVRVDGRWVGGYRQDARWERRRDWREREWREHEWRERRWDRREDRRDYRGEAWREHEWREHHRY